MTIETRPLQLTINGKKIAMEAVPVGMPMIDFLHEYLDLTGTHFGCGQGICHACTVVIENSDGTTRESRTCIFDAHFFEGTSLITIEGHATKNSASTVEELTPIQQAFIDHFSFQCGYCTPGFVAAASVFIDELKRHPIHRETLESAIQDALNDHICRCTGYVRYYEAVRAVALSTPGCIIQEDGQ